MKLPTLSVLAFMLIVSQGLIAQSNTYYVVQLGALTQDINKHAHLSDIANVYFQPQANDSAYELTLGSFSNLNKAEAVVKNLKNNNYPNAYLAPLPSMKGKYVYVVQLGNYNSNDEIDWDRYQIQKKIFTTIEKDNFKIVTGIFPDYQAALPLQNKLFEIGFTHAEVVKVNSIFLHEVNQADITFQQHLSRRGAGLVKEFTAKGGFSSNTSYQKKKTINKNTPPIINRVALSKSIAPGINEDIARLTVKNLQSILSIYGNYTAEPNGIYDDKTANAYYATVQLTPHLKEFSAIVESKAHINSGYFTDWSDVELLLSISEYLTGEEIDFNDEELKTLISLYTKPKPLSNADVNKVHDWMTKSNAQLQSWKANGKIKSESLQAYMLVSSKVEVLLEDYFLEKGFLIDDASNLAKASMFAMLVGNRSDI